VARKSKFAKIWHVEFSNGKATKSVVVGGKDETAAIENALHILPKRGRLQWSISRITWDRVNMSADY
jgi:hypothetical protein